MFEECPNCFYEFKDFEDNSHNCVEVLKEKLKEIYNLCNCSEEQNEKINEELAREHDDLLSEIMTITDDFGEID